MPPAKKKKGCKWTKEADRGFFVLTLVCGLGLITIGVLSFIPGVGFAEAGGQMAAGQEGFAYFRIALAQVYAVVFGAIIVAGQLKVPYILSEFNFLQTMRGRGCFCLL